MDFSLQRKFQIKETAQTYHSLKNENTNPQFIANLNRFSLNHLYPDLMSAYDNLSNKLKVPSSNIIFGYGSDSLLRDLTFVLDYNTIQILGNSYEMSLFYNKLFEKHIAVNEWLYNEEFTLHSKIEKMPTEVLYLVSPHCPTGVAFSYEQIKLYAQTFRYVVLDQAYTNPLTFDIRFLEFDNLIVLKTFSKLGGVPGMRLGYCVANQKIINKLALVKNLYEITINGAEYLQFICNNPQIIDEHIKDLEHSKKLFISKYGKIYSAGNFITIPGRLKLEGKNYTIDSKTFTRITIPYSG